MTYHYNGNAARNARIFELWDQNLSYGAIGFAMSISREVVAGVVFRARRAGLLAAATLPAKHKKRVDAFRPSRMTRPPRVRGRQVQTATRSVAVLQSPSPPLPPATVRERWHDPFGCTYICNDDPARPAWCNAPATGSWCPYHWGVVVNHAGR
jgi:hypothetical protein